MSIYLEKMPSINVDSQERLLSEPVRHCSPATVMTLQVHNLLSLHQGQTEQSSTEHLLGCSKALFGVLQKIIVCLHP